jgi:hypothetical protein
MKLISLSNVDEEIVRRTKEGDLSVEACGGTGRTSGLGLKKGHAAA